MSKTVLIVEKDLALMRSLREILEHRGFGVEETTDGKGAPELIRRRRPDCVVLAVDLDAGQNGYIICKKLKSEADLRSVPVIIIGDPKGFEKHQQLKTRAEDYLGKPFEAPSLVEHVGGLVGFPLQELPPPGVSDGFEPALMSAEELALDSGTGEVPVGQDSDFELVDSMFDERPSAPHAGAPLPPLEEEIPVSTDSAELQLAPAYVAPLPPPASANGLARPSRPPFQSSASVSLDPTEGRELRAKVTELTGALAEARAHAGELEGRLRELEQALDDKKAELDLSRSAPGKAESKEVFALRDAANKKDKEILRLKGELNAKEQEIVELRDKENLLEQQASEASGEAARKDAQLKAAQARAEQLTVERRRVDQQLLASREEGRSASARLSTLQTDYDALQARMGELEASLEPSQRGHQEAENARVQAEALLADTRGELDTARASLEDLRGSHERAQVDRDQLASQASSLSEELSSLRQRLAETEAGLKRHEERGQRREARLRAQQERLEQLKSSLQQAVQTLEQTPRESEDIDLDELAEA